MSLVRNELFLTQSSYFIAKCVLINIFNNFGLKRKDNQFSSLIISANVQNENPSPIYPPTSTYLHLPTISTYLHIPIYLPVFTYLHLPLYLLHLPIYLLHLPLNLPTSTYLLTYIYLSTYLHRPIYLPKSTYLLTYIYLSTYLPLYPAIVKDVTK